MAKARDEARSAIEKILDEKINPELLETLFESVLSLKKQARGWCPSCKKQVWVEIEDSKAVVSALNDLLIQAKGRPGQADSQEDRSFSLVNKVVLVASDN